jgi:tripartite ATP-independent transporter DctM subunit
VTILLFLSVLVGAIALGMPVAFALVLTGVALMYQLDFFNAQLVAQNMLAGADIYPLLAVPCFILAGELMNAGGISARIITLASSSVGHIRGGLGYVAIAATLLMGSFSGSALADTAAVATLLIPMMRDHGYPVPRSAGLIAAGGVIAPIVPPSMPFIIFGVTTNTSISSLFMAGIVPALMRAGGLVVVWWMLARNMDVVMQPRKNWADRGRALADALWALGLPVLIVGGLRGGLFTPTEASAAAAVYALLVSLFIYRELKVSQLFALFVKAARTSSMVMFLAAAAFVSSYMVTLADLPSHMSDMLGPLMEHPRLLMAAVMVLLLAIGSVMDLTPTILVLGPVLLPLVVKAGIDPTYFGVMFILVGTLGLIHPPVCTVLNTVCGIARISLESATRGVWPFLLMETALVFLFVIYPGFITVPLKWLH